MSAGWSVNVRLTLPDDWSAARLLDTIQDIYVPWRMTLNVWGDLLTCCFAPLTGHSFPLTESVVHEKRSQTRSGRISIKLVMDIYGAQRINSNALDGQLISTLMTL